MSAWIVGRDEIDLLVTGLLVLRNRGERLKPDEPILKTAQAIGQEFTDENYASVNYRYREDSTAPAYEFTPVGELLKDPEGLRGGVWSQVLESVHCLEYQSCEHPEWERSHAKQLVLEIERLVEENTSAWAIPTRTKWGWTRWDGFPE